MSALLVTTHELSSRLGDSNLVICDCRHDLMDLEKGRRAYAEGHISGAHFLHLDEDLSGEKTGKNGRHPLPDVDAFADHHRGMAAARHLCRVASGLDAAILGEAQVLSQVAGALRHAVSAHTVTPLLKDVFRTAVRGAEKARRTVWSAYRAADIGMAAASGAEQALGRLAGTAAVVVGAGEVAELSVRALQARGVAEVTIVNRTRDRAEAVSARHGVQSAHFEEMERVVSHADVVIVATGAPCVIVEAPLVRVAIARRADRPPARRPPVAGAGPTARSPRRP